MIFGCPSRYVFASPFAKTCVAPIWVQKTVPQPPMPFKGGVVAIIDHRWVHFVNHLV